MGILILKVDGALSNGQEIRWPVGFTVDITAVRITPAVGTAPAGTACVVRVQNATGASPAEFIEAQIAPTLKTGVTAGGIVQALLGASDFFLRVVTASGAANLLVTVEYVETSGKRNVLLADRDGAVPGSTNGILHIPGPAVATVISNVRFRALTPPSGTITFQVQPLFATLAIQPNSLISVSVNSAGETSLVIFQSGGNPLPLPGGSILRIDAITATLGASDLLLAIELNAPGVLDALCSVDDVKLMLGIDTPDTDDVIALAVTAASGMIRQLTRRYLTQTATITAERHERGSGSAGVESVPLNEWPVISVTQVRDENGLVLAAATYKIDLSNGILRSVSGGAFGTIEVDYATGFSAFLQGVPGDLRYAAILQAAFLYQQSEAGGGRLGNRGPASAASGSAGYVTGPWQPDARDAALAYQRLR